MTLKRRKNQEGQAAIEFIVSMLVIFFFLLFMLSLSILLVVSDYVEYATFMAARTYKAGASQIGKQEEHAEIVFNAYVDKIRGIARNFDVRFVRDPSDEQAAGMVVDYDIDMFYLPPIFMGNASPPSTIRLSSEAHLGRDPAFQDCQGFFNNIAGQLFGIDNSNLVEQLADNGC